MVERLIDREGLLLDTPFLRRIREEGRQEGRQEGHRAGWAEGLHAGMAEGQATGVLRARRRSILDVLVARFDPPGSVYQQIERQLEGMTDESPLAALLVEAIRAESVADFQMALERQCRSHASGRG